MNQASSYACINSAWRAHQAELRAFLIHRARNTEEGDDLLQEVFLKAMLQGQAFCGLDQPRAWLFQVARHLLIDRLRLSREQVPLPDDLLADPDPVPPPVDLLSHCLPRVLSELAPEDRDAITLCDIQGMGQKEYAQRLGLSLPAAKSRVQRARQRLRTHMAEVCQVRFDEDGKVCCFVPRPGLPPTS